MSTETKLRRGTAAQCAVGTPAEGELWIDLTNDRVRLGDGVLAGGHQIPNAVDIQKGSFNTINAGGTADAITVALTPAPVSYFNDMTIVLKIASTNTGTTTLNVNGLGLKDVYKVSGGSLVPLVAGDLTAGAYYTVRYDGTQFVLEGSSGRVSSVTGSAGIVVTPTTGTPNVSIDTNNAGGIGSVAMLLYIGSSVASGATAGSNLFYMGFDYNGGTGINTDGNQFSYPASGTWRNISGRALGGATTVDVGLFIRTA
jgi:hypothetical protein